MWSRMPGCARPVRIFARSCFSVSTDFAIFSVACFLISPIVIQSSAEFLPTNSTYAFQTSAMHQRALVFAHHHSLERPRLEDREYVDRKLLVAAKRERGGVHHLEVLHERLVEGELGVARGGLVLHGVGGIDAVHLGRLQDDIGLDLAPAQRGRRVGGEEWVAGARREDDDLAFLE